MIFVPVEMELLNLNTPASLIEVFKTQAGAIYQCDKKTCLYLQFGGKVDRYSYACLFRLKKAVDNVNIEHLLTNASKAPDIEIISIAACEHCYVLSITELIALRDLLQGTFVMFQLNNILKDCLQRYIA